jgi:hypothetical protein
MSTRSARADGFTYPCTSSRAPNGWFVRQGLPRFSSVPPFLVGAGRPEAVMADDGGGIGKGAFWTLAVDRLAACSRPVGADQGLGRRHECQSICSMKVHHLTRAA